MAHLEEVTEIGRVFFFLCVKILLKCGWGHSRGAGMDTSAHPPRRSGRRRYVELRADRAGHSNSARNRKNSSGAGADDSTSRSSSRYSCHALKHRILLIPPIVARIEEIRRRIGMEGWLDKQQTRRVSSAFRRLFLPDLAQERGGLGAPGGGDPRRILHTLPQGG